MDEPAGRICPDCGSRMESGYIGPPAYLRWWRNKKVVWTMIGCLFGERLAKGTWGNLPCWRCFHCGLVMFKERH